MQGKALYGSYYKLYPDTCTYTDETNYTQEIKDYNPNEERSNRSLLFQLGASVTAQESSSTAARANAAKDFVFNIKMLLTNQKAVILVEWVEFEYSETVKFKPISLL